MNAKRTAASADVTKDLENLLPLGEVGESVWIDVIRKMDEVYNDLLQYEVALEEKNSALEESQQFILSVLTSMSDVLMVCDRDGHIQDVNQALSRLTGKSNEQLRSVPLLELLADDASRSLARSCIQKVPNEAVQDCEVQLIGADGGSVPVTLNCTARYSATGKYVGMVLTGRPVGELRRAYRALHDAHEELKRAQQQLIQAEKLASLGRLVAGVAHELNNPISFVLGNVHALRKYCERLKTYLDAAHSGASQAQLDSLRKELRIDRILGDLEPLIQGTVEGAERTRSIVDGLKRFSAADRGENTVFNLTEVIERAARWVEKGSGTRMRMEIDLPRELPVKGSPGQLQQVVMNLVHNAADSTAQRPAPLLQVCGRLRAGSVAVEFHDNGPGIDPAHLSKVFDPFFTTKQVGMGTGLGLSISYGIVERHSGQLAATNHAQGGAVFTLTLPTATQA